MVNVGVVTTWIHELCAGGACAIVAGPEGSMVEVGPGARDAAIWGLPSLSPDGLDGDGVAGVLPGDCLPIVRMVV